MSTSENVEKGERRLRNWREKRKKKVYLTDRRELKEKLNVRAGVDVYS